MPRALFQKTGNAVYTSHLDLMRVFQRAFKRASLSLTHSQGFNPRPSVSIALPLSLGVSSRCELLDFDLEGEMPPNDEIRDRLNAALIDGVRVLSVYDEKRKIRDLAYLDCRLTLEYDAPLPDDAVSRMEALFRRPQLLMEKKSKNGNITQQDILPMIRSLTIHREDNHNITISARICCQNPSLNPMQLAAAIGSYLPDLTPDFTRISREEIYDQEEKIFR